jgi:tRNA G18 (ribose-2'-O)-methylase SpoU
VTASRIDHPGDPRLADYRALHDAAGLARRGLFVAEGQLVVRQLLASPFRARSILATDAAFESLSAAVPAVTPAYVAARELIAAVVGYPFHRGCLALGERGPEPTVDGVLAATPPALVALDDVSNPDNVGGIFRNALAFGAGGMLLSPGCADPLYRKAIRVSLGATLAVPFARVGDWPAGLAALRPAGYGIVALTPAPDAVPVDAVTWPARPVLVVGAEGPGLGAAVRALADVVVTIPMAPGVDSLNASTASGIALHRWAATRSRPR